MLLTACGQEAMKKPSHALARQPLSNGMVISQIFTGGGNANGTYERDYVVLYNRGSTPVTLTGWTLQYAGATANAWSVVDLSGTVQPAHSLLIGLNPESGSLPIAPDVSADTIALQQMRGKIALVQQTMGLSGACPTSNANVVDFVGYGDTPNCFEGAGRAPLASQTTALFRRNSGCQETDDNAADFVVGTPVLISSASGAIPCGTPLPDAGTPPTDAGTETDAGTTFDAGVVDAGVDAGVIPQIDAGSCTLFTGWPAVQRVGGYIAQDELGDPVDMTYGHFFTFANPDGGRDVLELEAWFETGLTLPSTYDYDETLYYGDCDVCAIVGRGCAPGTPCATYYFARSGSVTLSTASRDADAGSIAGTVSAVRFDEWDFDVDEPVADGGCVVVATASLSASWNNGGTGGGAGATGGGSGATGGGSGATGGGAGATGGGSAATGGGSGSDDGGTGGAGGSGEVDAGTGGGGGRMGGKGGCSCTSADPLSLVLVGVGALLARRRRRS